jgi:hypothetical protein
MCAVIFTATFVPMTFVAMWMYKVMKVDTVLRIASLMLLVGSWIRMLAKEGEFWPVFVGQVIISLAQPIIYNVMAKFAIQWFSDSERTLVIAACGLSIPGGNLMAFLMSGIIFDGVENVTNDLVVKQMLMKMLWVQNIWATVICVPYIIIIREKPAYPPSLCSLEKSKESNFCKEIKNALMLPNYVKLMISYALLQGGFISFGSNIS